MKKTLNKIKKGIAAFWVALISLFSKAIGKNLEGMPIGETQYLYWVPQWVMQLEYWVPSPMSSTFIVSKITQRSLIWVTFIVWIVNLVKIKKIDDKVQRKKKIKKTIIVIRILIILIVACIITTRLLKRY